MHLLVVGGVIEGINQEGAFCSGKRWQESNGGTRPVLKQTLAGQRQRLEGFVMSVR